MTAGGLRDTRADEEYFNDIIDHLNAFVATDDDRLRRPAAQWRKPEQLGFAAGDAMRSHWARFTARYSQGADRPALRSDFETVLIAAERGLRIENETLSPERRSVRFRKGGNLDGYRQRLWLVSIALALGVDDETFARTVAAVERSWGDRLLDRLIAARQPEHPVGAELEFPQITGLLDKALDADDSTQAKKLVLRYLSGWYRAWKGVWGWGGHEALPKKLYYGYWAFEVLGVAKILELDDSALRDNEFYPAGLSSD